jgi:hypothetical protein
VQNLNCVSGFFDFTFLHIPLGKIRHGFRAISSPFP